MFEYFRDFLSRQNLSVLSISGVGISDIFDILIVAYFIYRVVVWIKETRAWSLFKGVVVVIIVAALSMMFNFVTISWIVQNAFGVGFIAILIVFQPEMRKALEELGKHKNFLPFALNETGESSYVASKTFEEIAIAIEAMSKVKTGALILVEREVALGDLERTGIPIDAIVTSQLLINIFEHNTPLHDGALIIRSNRIAAATCILPLTQAEIGRELGTRHRAAVGASEVSDAVVIVVSEETGAISIAQGGKLYKKLKKEQIKEMFNKTVADEKKKFVLRRAKAK